MTRPISPVFITGGSGFLGRTLIRTFKDAGAEVRALARSDGSAAIVSAQGAEVVRGDLHDVDALDRGMRGAAAVVHSAAKVGDWGTRDQFYRDTVEGTENVLAAAARAAVGCLVHVSTEAVLAGGGPIHDVDETRPRPRKPLGLYAWSKGLAETRVLEAHAGGLEAMIIRPRFIWGDDDTTLLPQFIDAAHDGRLKWIGGGRYLTSTCHVRNVCEGALRAAQHGAGGQVYFLTDGAPVEFRDFMTRMLATQGVDVGNGEVPLWLARVAATLLEGVWTLFGRTSSPPLSRTAVALMGEQVTVRDDKARREIGYTSAVSVDEGLEQMSAQRGR